MNRVSRFKSRIVIYFLFILACIRTVAAHMLPGDGDHEASPGSVDSGSALTTRPLLLRSSASTGNSLQYGLEAIGVFPYVRLVPLPAKAVPVPIEVVGLPPGENSSLRQNSASPFLVHRAQGSAPTPDVIRIIQTCTETTTTFCTFCSGCDCTDFCS